MPVEKKGSGEGRIFGIFGLKTLTRHIKHKLRQEACHATICALIGELPIMETSDPLSDNFVPWREEVNRLLMHKYFIDLDMAGIADEYLLDHYEMNQMPADFVEWFAVKYDLHDFKW